MERPCARSRSSSACRAAAPSASADGARVCSRSTSACRSSRSDRSCSSSSTRASAATAAGGSRSGARASTHAGVSISRFIARSARSARVPEATAEADIPTSSERSASSSSAATAASQRGRGLHALHQAELCRDRAARVHGAFAAARSSFEPAQLPRRQRRRRPGHVRHHASRAPPGVRPLLVPRHDEHREEGAEVALIPPSRRPPARAPRPPPARVLPAARARPGPAAAAAAATAAG